MYRLKYFIIIVLMSISGCKEMTDDTVLSERAIAENLIDQFIHELIADQQIPGYSIAVTSRDSLIYSNSYGFSDLKLKEKVTDQTLFQIGSITKSFTAIALMQLYDQGKFDLNKPISDYLYWFNLENDKEKVTGHHLLTHRAGIQQDLDGTYGSPAMGILTGQLKSYGKLGETYRYSNIGYVVLHLLIENLSGLSYQEFVEKNILQPLEMDNTYAEITLDSREKQAIGYVYPFDDRPHNSSRNLVEAELFEYRMGNGSILSTPSDMANYMQMLLGNGTRKGKAIMSKEAFNLFTGINSNDKDKDWYQYGIVTIKYDSIFVLQHSGGMVGFSSNMKVDKSNDIAVYVSTNTQNGSIGLVTNYIHDVFKSLKNGDSIPKNGANNLVLKKDTINYTGTYQSLNGKQLKVKESDDGLIIIYNDELINIEKVGRNQFLSTMSDYDKYYWQFEKIDQNVPSSLIYGNKVYYNINYKGNKKFDFPKEWLGYIGTYRNYSPWFPYFEIIIREGNLVAITGYGGETSFEEIDLLPLSKSVFKIGDIDSPEQLNFGKNIGGHSITSSWSGHNFYWIDN
jgi:D-alanyl-D-alanine carboxypeptidase